MAKKLSLVDVSCFLYLLLSVCSQSATFFLFLSPGDRYWVFSESNLDSGYPKSLNEMGTGLPKDRIDTALYYTPTGQTFFFRANKLVIFHMCVCVCVFIIGQ